MAHTVYYKKVIIIGLLDDIFGMFRQESLQHKAVRKYAKPRKSYEERQAQLDKEARLRGGRLPPMDFDSGDD